MADIISQYKQLHAEGKFAGYSVLEHREQIKNLIRETESSSVLDYGCGKALPYLRDGMHCDWCVSLRLYDPAVPGFDARPEPADGVICCDVMEHIPESEVPGVLKHVIGLSRKFVFFVICTRPSKKFLPDGRNCHITIQPRGWWSELIDSARHGSTARIEVVFRDGL